MSKHIRNVFTVKRKPTKSISFFLVIVDLLMYLSLHCIVRFMHLSLLFALFQPSYNLSYPKTCKFFSQLWNIVDIGLRIIYSHFYSYRVISLSCNKCYYLLEVS